MNFSSGSQGSWLGGCTSWQNLLPPVGTTGQAVSSPTICTNSSVGLGEQSPPSWPSSASGKDQK